jgi:phage/plasmid-associated DNA primase
MRLRELSHQRKDIQLTAAQEDCIESLLAESDSLRLFIKQCVRRERGASITSDEILAAYENYCATKGWSALPRKRFESQAGPLMMEFHQAAKRNDLKRGNTSKRGFMHVEIIETDTPTSEL